MRGGLPLAAPDVVIAVTVVTEPAFRTELGLLAHDIYTPGCLRDDSRCRCRHQCQCQTEQRALHATIGPANVQWPHASMNQTRCGLS